MRRSSSKFRWRLSVALLVSAVAALVLCAREARYFGGVASASAQAPIVVNGGFETPVVSEVEVFDAPVSFGGWTVDSGRVKLAASSSWAPAAGAQSIEFAGEYGEASLSQTVAVEAGRRYRLSFSHSDGPVAPPGGYTACGAIAGVVMPLDVFWDGVKLATIEWTGGHLTDDWQQFATLVTATGGNGQLRFLSRSENGAHCGMTLDDVALSTASAAQTATTLKSSANPSVIGQPVTFTATVISGDPATVPAGTVQFEIDGAPAGSPVPVDSTGHASHTSSALAVGQHTVRADYEPAGGTSFEASEAQALAQSVAKGDTTTSVAVEPDPTVAGQAATFTAVVQPDPSSAATPSGTIAFVDDDGTPIEDPQPLDADGKATLTVASQAGDYLVHANYSGDARFNGSTATTPQTVNRADTVTTITSAPNPVAPGGEVEFTVDVTVVEPGDIGPFGSLQFTVDGAPIGPSIPLEGSSGVVVTFTAPDTPQTATVSVVYSGDHNTNPSSASLSQIVASTSAGSPPPPPADTTAPALQLSGATAQRVMRQRGVVVLAACPAEACTVTAKGKVSIRASAKVFKLAPVTKQISMGGKTRLTLRLKRRALRAIGRALKAGKTVSAKVSVTAKDAAGNVTTKRRTIRLKR